MTIAQKLSTTLLVLLLAAAGIGWWKTAPPTARVTKQRAAALAAAELVDQSTYTTAQRLARAPTTPQEKNFWQSALRGARHAPALSLPTPLPGVGTHPPEFSP